MSNDNIVIRTGTREDIPAAFALVQELALFEKAPHEVDNTPERMLQDGFGENPVFGFLMAEAGGQPVGMSLYYFRYSTWKGRRLYLEDLIVTEAYRGKGLGKLLFEATMKKALELNCYGMSWQVLDWNTPAIEFYKKYGAALDGEWVNCSLSRKQLEMTNA
jgi:GNAT superfamily N-acetyltransferase